MPLNIPQPPPQPSKDNTPKYTSPSNKKGVPKRGIFKQLLFGPGPGAKKYGAPKNIEKKETLGFWGKRGFLHKHELKKRFDNPDLFTKTGGMGRGERAEFFKEHFGGGTTYYSKKKEAEVLKRLRRQAGGAPTEAEKIKARRGIRLMEKVKESFEKSN
ncbi:MAG: hypothetical protein KJI71_03435 [Patescibacteria group bacterium]|nr:hypothetical protein [Patescibacteria group bacterium]